MKIFIYDEFGPQDIAMMQALFGWAWDTNFNKDRCHFMLKLAWEAQYWFRVNQMAYDRVMRDPGGLDVVAWSFYRPSEDMILQGGTLELRFDF